ncbi:esterase-like activity of phytase family protein [Cellulophaga baltica]|uniref:esterase-like activity of phytase family protein n=1 Tax=Cellulophaga baltica TaxID=76594 RepID=UPI0024949D38|nr:esterase-like activity of phytase family protein [Cellulophaga baltica]
MKTPMIKLVALAVLFTIGSCDSDEKTETPGTEEQENITISEVQFVNEFILPAATVFENTTVGGLSGIDYANNTWYMISDAPNAPHFYTAAIALNQDGISAVTITSVNNFKDATGTPLETGITDPEAIRFADGNVLWTSEGNMNNLIDPSVRIAALDGTIRHEITLPERYKATESSAFGPRHNGVFEGLSLSYDGNGYWVSMELPLKQDGEEPTLKDTEAPVRIAYIDKATNTFGKEIAYELDAVARPALLGTTFELNGVVEILSYDENKFLVVERSFSTGYADGGNTVKIYKVDATNATDVSTLETLKGATYTKATKTLLFDFETVRDQLTENMVDNIEGITFGPTLENGNRSLVLVADNNFSAFIPQLNQFILLEILN